MQGNPRFLYGNQVQVASIGTHQRREDLAHDPYNLVFGSRHPNPQVTTTLDRTARLTLGSRPLRASPFFFLSFHKLTACLPAPFVETAGNQATRC
jgi:hypothetical protein